MKKILFMLWSMNIGGTEKALLNMITENLNNNEYDVTLLLLEKSGGFLQYVPKWVHVKTLDGYDNIKEELSAGSQKMVKQLLMNFKFITLFKYICNHIYFRLTQDRSPYWKFLFRQYDINVEGTYDIAVAYQGPDDFISTCVLNLVAARLKLQWIHFDVRKYVFHTYFAQKNYPRFDYIYAVSDDALTSLLHCVPQIKDKSKTYYNHISSDLCLKMAEIGQGFEDDFQGVRLLTVGRLSEEKGQDLIPDIVNILRKYKIEFIWYIIGEGPLRNLVEEKIHRYGISDYVKLLGAKPNPYPFFKQASIYVQTSLHEGFGMALAEAKIFGLPIVTTDVSGAQEQLQDYKEAYIVSHDKLKEALFLRDIIESHALNERAEAVE